jgi:lysophospholipase L1-like esterase
VSLAVKLLLSPLLLAQALATRARMPRLPEAMGPRQGKVGQGPALRLLVAGDSSAAGVGVATQHQALAGPMAQQLAQAVGVCVHWQLVARSGLTTQQTLQWLCDAPPAPADVAVVVTGVNDVVERISSPRAVAARDSMATWWHDVHGVQHVVFAPLPPVHRFPGLPQPLRWVAGADARRHNAALVRWAGTRGDVSCVDMDMSLEVSAMASDGFHPGEPVYRYCAETIARHIATQVWPGMRP